MLHWFCLISRRLFDVWTSYFGIMSQYDPTCDLKTKNKGHCDIYFSVHWFCLLSWRLCNVWTSYFAIMSQYDPTFDIKINVGHCDLYFMVHWFCILSLKLFDARKKTNTYISWSRDFSFILKVVWCMNIIIWDYESVWPAIWPKINVGHCDLYFMVEWFCLIFPRLFDWLVLYL